MQQDIQLRVEPATAASDSKLKSLAARHQAIRPERIKAVRVTRRAVDARQRKVMLNITLRIWIDELPPESLLIKEEYNPLIANAPEAIVIGAGPAGLFAALRLIQLGIKPIVFERGKTVERRASDMANIAREGHVNPESNYCFGEGGAGAYSDGKLFTRSKKRGSVEKILHILVQHGAKEEILVDAHPHIGTDRLPLVVKAIRETIKNCGGEVKFETRVDELVIKHNSVIGVKTASGEFFPGPVILATGHSARDVYRSLYSLGIELHPKGIAIGVRLEHPQKLIDKLQYHCRDERGPYLPPAEYSFLTRIKDRGVYSFCMCPGGVIVPASSAEGELVVNGMSPSSRGGRWANSGMVVEILPEDVPIEFEKSGPLKVMAYQEAIEKCFFADSKEFADREQSSRNYNSPAQRMTDFVEGKSSIFLPASSYAPGIHPARVDKLLPEAISSRLRAAFREFDNKRPGFLTSEATVIGAETRTSAPVRIPRDKETLQHIGVAGLFPCGEGAGYAGGIVSAAIDGDRCAQALASYIATHNTSA